VGGLTARCGLAFEAPWTAVTDVVDQSRALSRWKAVVHVELCSLDSALIKYSIKLVTGIFVAYLTDTVPKMHIVPERKMRVT
jgi:hypothetical protein